jgi:hypothetical protein
VLLYLTITVHDMLDIWRKSGSLLILILATLIRTLHGHLTVAPETGFPKHTLIKIWAPLLLTHTLPFLAKGNEVARLVPVVS